MISVYIHIPFCFNICNYCDFCKVLKNDFWIDQYLNSLKKEIIKYYKGEKVKTLYFGGGTPSLLTIRQLKKLFSITNIFNLVFDAEITFECNCEDLTTSKLEFLKNKVNRLSIGVQTFNAEFLKVLGRKKVNIDKILLAKKYFDNINIDLMYGLPNQSVDDLKKDILKFLELDLSHLSAYSLILEKNTKFYIDGYKTNDDILFEELISEMLLKNGYNHYEISNYAKAGMESKHNLTYWNNEKYYGFGLGSSGYIGNIRHDNTRSLNKYLNGEYRLVSLELDMNTTLQNEFILGFRKINGINKKYFEKKYGFDMKDVSVIRDLLACGYLLENDDNIYISLEYISFSNEILVKFLETIYPNGSL